MRRIIMLFQENAFVRNSSILFAGSMLMNVLNYLFHLVLGRVMGPAEYGEVESLISFLTIISVPAATLGLIATKYSAAAKADDDQVGARSIFVYLNKIVLRYGAWIFIVAMIVTPFVKDFFQLTSFLPIIFLWIVAALAFFSAIAVGILSGWHRFHEVNYINISGTLSKFVFALLFVLVGFGVNGALGGLALAGIVGYVVAYVLIKKHFRGLVTSGKEQFFDFSSLKGYALPAFLGTLSISVLGNIDMVFAKHSLDPVLSGEYSALSVAAKTIFFATGVMATVLFAMTAEGNQKKENSQKTFRLAVGLTALISAVSTLFFFFFPEFVLALLFGGKYTHMSDMLGWFALAAGLYAVGNLFLQYLLSLHETTIAYFFLALISLEILSLFLLGTNLYAIIGINILAQVVAIGIGWFFLYQKKYHV